MNDLLFKDEKVFENDVCIFYQNEMTKIADVWIRDWGMKSVRCFLVVQKKDSSDKEYVLVDGNEIVYANTQYEAVGARIDIMALDRGLKRG
jgi:hypothetical protein